MAKYGFPLSPEEQTDVDARFRFAALAHEDIGPFVQSLPTFGGMYFDHEKGGQLVVLLTQQPDQALLEDMRDRLPTDNLGLEIATTDTSWAEKEAAAQELATSLWPELLGNVAFTSISASDRDGSVRVEVGTESDLEAVNRLLGELSKSLGVTVEAQVGEMHEAAACTDREHCTSPMMGGIVIRKGSTSGASCTMGFHVQVGSDEQFITAGHCGYTGSNYWYHKGYGQVGVEIATQFTANGRDVMRVGISDVQDSSILYASSTPVTAMYDPYNGEGICASRGVSSSSWGCGAVTSTSIWYTPTAGGPTVHGADSSVSIIGGDSGSPMVDSYDNYIALGIATTTGGGFTRVEDALSAWGITLRQ